MLQGLDMDSATSGRAPLPWEIELPPSNMFKVCSCLHYQIYYRVSTKKVYFSPPDRKAKVNFFFGHPRLGINKVKPWSSVIIVSGLG